jgi:1-acyl-sn-glycerol-3-phosphate acyltransferase
MSAPGTQFDRKAFTEAQARAAARQLLIELGGDRGLEALAARGFAAHLERDLGLGSLERVELAIRLSADCGVSLSDNAAAEADTLQDLINAVLRAEPGSASAGLGARDSAATPGAPAATSSRSAAPFLRPDLEESIRAAVSLTEIIRLRGLGEPQREHIHLYDSTDAVRTITYGELYERASSVASELIRRGLEPGQTVAIMLPTCAEFFWSFAGTLLAGAIPVPIYPPFRADRIAEYATRQANILRNAEARFLITWREAEGLAHLLEPRVPSLRGVLNAEKIANARAAAEMPEPSSEWRPVRTYAHHAAAGEIALLQYTSGSTGDPKGVTLTHANLLANIRAIAEAAELGPRDVGVTWLPLYHDMGLIGVWLTPLYAGVPVVVMSPLAFLSRPVRWLWAIHRHRGTVSPAPNFAYELCVRKIADNDLQGLDLSSWRAALNGAEPVHASTLERFAARFAPYGFRREAMTPVYGLAEASLAVSAPKFGTAPRVDRINRPTFESEGRAVPAAADDPAPLEFVGAGKPLANVQVRIVAGDAEAAAQNGREVHDCPERTQGRLWFRSPSATSGYYRNPRATADLMRGDGWLDSGDLAYRADGDIFITGRAKDVIIKRGRNLYPHEVEAVAASVEGVRAGCVVAFGVPDEKGRTEKLIVTAEARKGADAKRLASEITRAVDAAMGLPPDAVEILPPQSIPKTSSGKLRRSETRRLYLEKKLGKKSEPAWMQIGKLAASSAAPRIWSASKRGTRRAVDAVYGVYALAVFSVVLIPSWLAVSFTRNARHADWITRKASRLSLLFAGVPVRVEGREVLRELSRSRPFIFAPNHSSYADILVSFACLPPGVRFIAKGEVLDMPLVGKFARRAGQFAFDRNDPHARVRQAEEVNAALREGTSVTIFPEGTFTSLTGIRPFQLGAFKAAVDTSCPICPVAIRGARRILRDETFLPRPGRVTVTFGPLVAPAANGKEDWREMARLRDETREIIARHVGEPLL